MYVREDFTDAIDLLASGAVPIDEIISARFDFEHSAEAFTASADAENVKVIVTVGGSKRNPVTAGATSTGSR
jgi:threonine dehydrogenase-like Zn-dependent dehydrogenase